MDDSTNSLRGLFEAALALPPDARAAFLSVRCADANTRAKIEALLAADAGVGEPLEQASAEQLARKIGEIDDDVHLTVGARIGPFELLEVLGEGGSSTVFRAQRENDGVIQQVALKLLHRNMHAPDAQRRFRAERKVLAQLQHPGIARLIEGGVTDDGLGYIALELVDGIPITEYARKHKLNLRARLHLFVQACAAVAASHRALIVHRDLKPSNVLVTPEGAVKLLDFGIAKLLDDDTLTAVPAFTPAYAAPEQRHGGPISTATDVYALGVLLGELIIGKRLDGSSGHTPSGQIAENTEPGVLPAPAHITRRQLRGDLDTIVLKAIETDPERRYASASALADDVDRLLAGQPVSAHPPTRWYRTQKFVARHRGGVVTTAAFLLAIFAALGIALWQAKVARSEAQHAAAMRDFMMTAFTEATPTTPRSGSPSIAEVVEQALTNARGAPDLNPEVRTELISDLGEILRAQGQLEAAREVLQWNHDQALRAFGIADPLTLQAGHQLAATLIRDGAYHEARSLLDSLLAQTASAKPDLAAKLRLDSALLASMQHQIQRALSDVSDGLQLARQTGSDKALAEALGDVGNVQLSAARPEAAIATYTELLDLELRRLGPSHRRIAGIRASLSRAYRRAGRPEDAEREIRAALVIARAVLPTDDWRLANHLNALTMVLDEARDYRAALASSSEALRIKRVALGNDHPSVVTSLHNIGMMHYLLEDDAAAVKTLNEALVGAINLYGEEHYETAVTRAAYGRALAHAGQVTAGEAELRHALASFDAAAEPSPDDQARVQAMLVRLDMGRGDVRAALTKMDRIDALLQRMDPPTLWWDGRGAALRAAVLLQAGELKAAQQQLKSAQSALRTSSNPDPVLMVEVPLLQATAAVGLDMPNAAAGFAQTGITALANLRNPPSRLVALAKPLRSQFSTTR